MVSVQVNSNFHTVGGKSLFEMRDSPAYIEYRQKWDQWPKSFTIGSFPLHLDIEASSVCNLKCSFCETNFDAIGTREGYMSMDTFRTIINEGAWEGLYAVKLNSGARGEPLLNKKVPDMVRYAKKKGVLDVYFNTNATLLTEDIAKKVLDAGLDRISISFEGTRPEIYEKYRIGARYQRTLSNIMKFIELRDAMESTTKIRIQTVAAPDIIPDMEEYSAYWVQHVDEVAYIDFKDYGARAEGLTADWACPYLWQRMMITYDGTISVCGFDYSNDHHLGNVMEGSSIREAWQGEEMSRIRDLHKKGMSHEIPICDGCPYRTTELLKILNKGEEGRPRRNVP